MAGPTTAERGERQQESSGPPLVRRLGPRRIRTIIILALGAALLGAGVVWVLYGSQWLRVERVSVSGTAVLTPGQVREAADVPVGAPLVSVDTDVIRSRLVRELTRIDTVEVARSWPHGIRLKVTERVPVLTVQKGGKFVEVDRGGVRFATVDKAPAGVPALELTLSRTASSATGMRRFGEDRLVREAVRVAGSVPTAVRHVTRTVKVLSYDDISLVLRGGRTVAWGSGENSAAKGRTLSALMKAAPDARHFDVSVPTAPASATS
ncbi:MULTISPECIES: cell division protein FtsQ/DivIB [Streptomyces]|uniref:Cell division protein FtsQ n=1 Tax=Streptomyces doudnae TaxID=3075536 RepID=A0ABD5ENI4_9ACTN|nr:MULTISPECIES: FtsQ-type POTRA domain-containing protein [unclassified Streptomyces]MDT0435309.1 FtsQ-type POTRA domain-containing protein [Streptomyces sp. DSM 41981]MYQ66475.1 FtsQ-type POTRA domain-containing protein [Streptomyces sp. SID4950]SCE20919.1 cell division protein FtsQ [Streptomyces sp. SolWspMP-5a-2]